MRPRQLQDHIRDPGTKSRATGPKAAVTNTRAIAMVQAAVEQAFDDGRARRSDGHADGGRRPASVRRVGRHAGLT